MTLGLLLLYPAAAQAQSSVELEITGTSGTITIVAPGTPRDAVTGTPGLLGQQQQRRRLVSIKVQRIDNFQGNNPLNQEEPVQNFDGQTFDSVAETVAASTGNAGVVNGDLSGCIRTVTMQPSGTAPANFRFASFDIDPNNGSCNLVADGSTGSALIVQTPPDGGDPGDGVAFPDVGVGLFTIINPAPDSFSGSGVLLTSNTPVTITIRATNGFTVAISFQIVPLGGDNFQLQVSNVVQQ